MVASKLGRITWGERVFRFGGEEFSVIFPGRSVAEAVTQLEALRMTVAGSCFVLRGSDRPRLKPAAPKMLQTPQRGVFVTFARVMALDVNYATQLWPRWKRPPRRQSFCRFPAEFKWGRGGS